MGSQGKAATMGDVSGQVPGYGHSKPAAEGIEGLEASYLFRSSPGLG